MSIIPMLRATIIVRALRKAGFQVIRQRGSHVHLRHSSDQTRYATVPYHSKDISRKDLASILKQSQLSVEEFLKLLGK